MEIAFGIIVLTAIGFCGYHSVKDAMAEKKLDEIYKKREEERLKAN